MEERFAIESREKADSKVFCLFDAKDPRLYRAFTRSRERNLREEDQLMATKKAAKKAAKKAPAKKTAKKKTAKKK
jgi:hypothetical protein